MSQFLDTTGLAYFYNQIKKKFAAVSHKHSAGDIASGTLPISSGGTGATTAAEALVALGISDAITGLSVNGTTITYTKKDGTAGTIITQDTVTSAASAGGIIAASIAENGFVKFANGFIIQWGNAGTAAGDTWVTFPITFSWLLQIQLTWNANSYENPKATSWNNSGFSYWVRYADSNKWWMAIGI